MSSYINKLVNSVTNQTSTIIGRENLAKFSNSINKTFIKSKFRDNLKPGNVVQIISKNSHMALQICSSRNDPDRLILLGDGQIGEQYFPSQFLIEKEPKHGHLKFRNKISYMAFDQDVPCVLTEPTTKPKHKHELIRARNEFRVHEIIGSDEYFALESVYFPGKYISVLPDGSIGVTRNKADESTHLCLHVIYVAPENVNAASNTRPQSMITQEPIPVNDRASTIYSDDSNDMQKEPSEPSNRASFIATDQSNRASFIPSEQSNRASYIPTASSSNTEPPNYQSLFPQLPKH